MARLYVTLFRSLHPMDMMILYSVRVLLDQLNVLIPRESHPIARLPVDESELLPLRANSDNQTVDLTSQSRQKMLSELLEESLRQYVPSSLLSNLSTSSAPSSQASSTAPSSAPSSTASSSSSSSSALENCRLLVSLLMQVVQLISTNHLDFVLHSLR